MNHQSKEDLNKDGLTTSKPDGKPTVISSNGVGNKPLCPKINSKESGFPPKNERKVPRRPMPNGMVGAPRSYFESLTVDFDCSIELKPTEIKFTAKAFWITLYIKNTSTHRVCFKIHPPNPKYYTVSPLSGFVEAGKQSFVAVNRLKPVDFKDKLKVEYGADTGVEQASVLFDDRYVDSDEIVVHICASV